MKKRNPHLNMVYRIPPQLRKKKVIAEAFHYVADGVTCDSFDSLGFGTCHTPCENCALLKRRGKALNLQWFVDKKFITRKEALEITLDQAVDNEVN